MNMKQASQELAKLGFNMGVNNTSINYGVIASEPFFPVGAKEFTPINRHVFIGSCVNGFYVTSHIKGYVRMKYHRHTDEATYKNIFGGGSTLQEAIATFVSNFKSKTYNIS